MDIKVFSKGETRIGQISEIESLLKSETDIFWVDIFNCTDAEARILRDVFKFHPLAIEDTRNHRQRPKIEEYEGYMFLIINSITIFNTPDKPTSDNLIFSDLSFREIDLFVGRNYVVSVHNLHEATIDEVKRRFDILGKSFNFTTSYVLYTLLDVVVDQYFPIMDMFEEEIGNLEDIILANPDQKHLNRLFELKHMMLHMWRVVWPERDMLSTLAQPHILNFTEQNNNQYYLRDVADHLLWIADMLSTYRDTLSTVIDLYMSSVSNKLNHNVQRLTILTLIIGILTVVSGFYGMNFTHTWPPFESPYGVPFVLLLMMTGIGGLLLLLKRINR
ncbi:MAG: magnesium transporter CorA family protein [Anaerolineae bacterium]|nr:magnesium transporter CorA family protein [Anaerolineae bacterium]